MSSPSSDSQFTRSDLLAGQVAVVTGSSRGLGQAIAVQLAAAGADVVVHGRRPGDSATQTMQKIRELQRVTLLATADLADRASHEPFFETCWNWKGRVDIWVNNAGADVLTGHIAQAAFEEKLDVLWPVDVLGTIRLSRLAGKRMQEQGRGAIINIGWDQAAQGMASDSGEMFAAIKGAVMAFTRSLAQSLAPHVRVNCVAPGWIKTAWGETASDYWQQRAEQESLRGRWGTPEDVAKAVCFLASPAADFITGQIVNVNGGFRYSKDQG